jgi:hypothetical protein
MVSTRSGVVPVVAVLGAFDPSKPIGLGVAERGVVCVLVVSFQGMKPIFQWASYAPWTEMQLQALSAPDYATALQQIWKAVCGLLWFAVLARVLGYLMYSHFVLSRQVRMRNRYPPGVIP